MALIVLAKYFVTPPPRLGQNLTPGFVPQDLYRRVEVYRVLSPVRVEGFGYIVVCSGGQRIRNDGPVLDSFDLIPLRRKIEGPVKPHIELGFHDEVEIAGNGTGETLDPIGHEVFFATAFVFNRVFAANRGKPGNEPRLVTPAEDMCLLATCSHDL